jgi:hypothetical protein
MRHHIVAAIASVGVVGLMATGLARAQAPRPILPQSPSALPSNPAVSPYLNLLRSGSSPAVNYYGIVRPQQQYNAALTSLEQQVAFNRVAITAAENAAVPSTGHPIYFLNYQRFFLNTGAVAPFQNLQATAGAGAGSAAAGSSAGQRAISNIISGATTPSLRR